MKTYFKPVLIASVVGLAIGMSACSEARTADKNAADQVSAAAAPAAAPIAAANWDIQAGRSHIRFTAKQEGSPFSGEFQAFSGIINFDPAAPQNGSVKITVPLKALMLVRMIVIRLYLVRFGFRPKLFPRPSIGLRKFQKTVTAISPKVS